MTAKKTASAEAGSPEREAYPRGWRCGSCGTSLASFHDAIRHAEDDHGASGWTADGQTIRPKPKEAK